MAEQTIDDLTVATDIYSEDKFLLQQNQQAKSLPASKLTQFVTRNVVNVTVETVAYDATPVSTYSDGTLNMQVQRGPGIQSITKTSTSGLVDTYTVKTQDNETAGTFTVTNGSGAVNKVMSVSPNSSGNITKSSLMNLIYPVGSVYMTTEASNPATLLGVGTWTQIKGKFLYAAENTFSATPTTGQITVGDTGGDKTHTLDIKEIPNHAHNVYDVHTGGSGSNTWGFELAPGYGTGSTFGAGGDPDNSYATKAFSIMPPYECVYIWKRTA